MISAIVIAASLALSLGDFPICTEENPQLYPEVIFAENLYYAFWTDYRFSAEGRYSIFGARVTTDNTVLDPGGILLFKNMSDTRPAAAFDGTNLLVVFQDSC